MPWLTWDGAKESLPDPMNYDRIRHRDGVERDDFPFTMPWAWKGKPHHESDIVAFHLKEGQG